MYHKQEFYLISYNESMLQQFKAISWGHFLLRKKPGFPQFRSRSILLVAYGSSCGSHRFAMRLLQSLARWLALKRDVKIAQRFYSQKLHRCYLVKMFTCYSKIPCCIRFFFMQCKPTNNHFHLSGR